MMLWAFYALGDYLSVRECILMEAWRIILDKLWGRFRSAFLVRASVAVEDGNLLW